MRETFSELNWRKLLEQLQAGEAFLDPGVLLAALDGSVRCLALGCWASFFFWL